MTTLLQLNSSLFGSAGQSTQLADRFVAGWRLKHADAEVIVRDLASNPLPHLDAVRVTAFFTPLDQRTAQQQAYVDESDSLIAELQQAQFIVIGLPMYNFGIPSTLKAYLDQIARAGITFKYTETGAVGLLSDKQVIVFATRGGLYAGSPLDTESQYIRDFLGFLGLTDVSFVYAEGLNMGDAAKESGLAHAEQEIAALLA